MDPLSIVLLVLFVGIPALSVLMMVAFAASADYEPLGVEIRGGNLRGAIAASVAKILVGDAKTFQLPLLVVLEKTGLFGASTPLIGGATVRDVEWRIYADGEHVSTVTEASSVRVGARTRRLHLPVNAEVHLPRGLVGTFRKYLQDRRRGHELRIEVRGHVIVKHWAMTREVPVRVTRHVVLGDALPRLELAFVPHGTEPVRVAVLEVRLDDPYQDEPLAATCRIQVQEHRRLRRDPVVQEHVEEVRLEPGEAKDWRFRVAVPGATEPHEEVVLRPRILWGDRTLEPEGPAAGDGPDDAPHQEEVPRIRFPRPRDGDEGIRLDPSR